MFATDGRYTKIMHHRQPARNPVRTALACLVGAAAANAILTMPTHAADSTPTLARKENDLSDKFTTLRPGFSVSPQLSKEDIATAAALGYTLIVNNRPDGEMFGQPKSAELEAAARAAGMSYAHIPVDGRGVSMEHVSALKEALDAAGEKTLAFCRSGTRSTFVQAFLAASQGRPADEIIAEAAAAGYDISSARQALEALNTSNQEG